MKSYFLYIAKCLDSSLYVGISSDPQKRIISHNSGRGASWIKQHGAAEIVFTENFVDYLTAHRRELQIKGWSRNKKLALISGKIEELRVLSKRRINEHEQVFKPRNIKTFEGHGGGLNRP